MNCFQEILACNLTEERMKDALQSKGYILIRGLIPQSDITNLLREVTNVLSDAGWFKPGFDPLDRVAAEGAACGDPDPDFKHTYQQVFNLEAFHALPHHLALRRAMNMIVGDRILIHPKPIGRLIFPNCERLTVHAHQDYRFMGGDPECFTVWIPLHDCPLAVGPLKILEGSHLLGYQQHDDQDLHVPEIPAGSLASDQWVSGPINAGDVLMFHSLTVHAASPNVSNQLRISLDCRFQDYRRPVNPANFAFAGDSKKSWEGIYSGWQSERLKYYWRRLPLSLSPSKSELRQMILDARSSTQRVRYARILDQLN